MNDEANNPKAAEDEYSQVHSMEEALEAYEAARSEMLLPFDEILEAFVGAKEWMGWRAESEHRIEAMQQARQKVEDAMTLLCDLKEKQRNAPKRESGKQPSIEPIALAKKIALSLGYEWDTLYENKQDWTNDRGKRHDINTPYKTDFIGAAEDLRPYFTKREISWLPMETAPQDGKTFINVLLSDGSVDVASWDRGLVLGWSNSRFSNMNAKGWMPMPKPPRKKDTINPEKLLIKAIFGVEK